MQETTPTKPTTTAWQGHSAFSIMVATFLTMIVVLLISGFSFLTSVTLGSFTGFCMAAWNWFRLGKRRKAFAHLLLGLGVYILFPIGYGLLAGLLLRAFPTARPTGLERAIASFIQPDIGWISTSTNALFFLLIVYSLIVVLAVLFYLYRATVRDVPKDDPADDNYEIDLRRFLPLLGIAALSSVAITIASIFTTQIRTAQLQNHVYCELLRPDMTIPEVEQALNEIGPHRQMWFQDTPYPSLFEKASYYRVVDWDSYSLDAIHDLSLWLGYDANDRLVWIGRYLSGMGSAPIEERLAAIQCPWTFSQSVTAR
jgi:hypothetical protein